MVQYIMNYTGVYVCNEIGRVFVCVCVCVEREKESEQLTVHTHVHSLCP